MPYKDPEKQREAQRLWNLTKKGKENQAKVKRRRVEWFREYKRSLHCKRCGVSFRDVIGSFHHPNDLLYPDSKNYNKPQAIVSKGSMRLVKEMLSVTVPLCLKCHRHVHIDAP